MNSEFKTPVLSEVSLSLTVILLRLITMDKDDDTGYLITQKTNPFALDKDECGDDVGFRKVHIDDSNQHIQ
jgi:hypothetical protein